MSTGADLRVGNILGSSRAETDQRMLRRAFVKTVDYSALIETTSFNFVVGRRGAGKSALYTKVSEYFATTDHALLVTEKPQEHETLEMQRVISHQGNSYKSARAVYRVLWRTYLLLAVLAKLRSSQLQSKLARFKEITDYAAKHSDLLSRRGPSRCDEMLKRALAEEKNIQALPAVVARLFEADALADHLKACLAELKMKAVVLYDGLDEGWDPTALSTAVLGGLAAASADLAERGTEIHSTLFIRDNMFRSLAHFDGDFSRHIEGETLRLQWNEHSLLEFVAQRLREAFALDIESNIKVWNRFAHQSLEGIAGFRKCLGYTLYRPRDIPVLLNNAYLAASREGRHSIVDADIEGSAKRISQDRLEDLFKEYEDVFPGLRHCADLFRAGPPRRRFGEVISVLDDAVARTDYRDIGGRDFPIFGSGREMFSALFSVGFTGLHDLGVDRFRFCHDGASSDVDVFSEDQATIVHPCYWKALEVHADAPQESVLIDIPDEYQVPSTQPVRDQRTKLLGRIVTQLSNIAEGPGGASDFESWVSRAVQILFAGKLTNPELRPNPNSIQQRDLVATNMASEGLWKRVLDDYGARQIVFEIKNYAELNNDDFRQALSYATPAYGNFVVIVTRGLNTGLSAHARNFVKEIWDGHKKLLVVVPAETLRTCLQKLRKARSYDYTEDTLGKLLDTYTRKYLSLHIERFRRKSRRRKK